MECLSATLWTSEGVHEPMVSKPQSLNKLGDLGRGSSARSLGLHLLSWWSFPRFFYYRSREQTWCASVGSGNDFILPLNREDHLTQHASEGIWLSSHKTLSKYVSSSWAGLHWLRRERILRSLFTFSFCALMSPWESRLSPSWRSQVLPLSALCSLSIGMDAEVGFCFVFDKLRS